MSETHKDGIWCANLRCSKCYTADIWQKAELAKLRQMVAQQAEDEGLWFNAATAPEAYLQQELRRLHAAVEGTK